MVQGYNVGFINVINLNAEANNIKRYMGRYDLLETIFKKVLSLMQWLEQNCWCPVKNNQC